MIDVVAALIIIILIVFMVFDPTIDVTEDDSVIIWYTSFSGDRKYIKF